MSLFSGLFGAVPEPTTSLFSMENKFRSKPVVAADPAGSEPIKQDSAKKRKADGIDGPPVKLKKKKKTKTSVDDEGEPVPVKKKKKSKSSSVPEPEMHPVEPVQKPKRSKKSKPEAVEAEAEIEEPVPSKKLKKKRAKRGDELVAPTSGADNEGTPEAAEASEGKKKKKSKKKHMDASGEEPAELASEGQGGAEGSRPVAEVEEFDILGENGSAEGILAAAAQEAVGVAVGKDGAAPKKVRGDSGLC